MSETIRDNAGSESIITNEKPEEATERTNLIPASNPYLWQAYAKFKATQATLKEKPQPTYDNTSHWSVITQTYGSVYVTVFPYCVVNLLITLLVLTLRDYLGVDVGIAKTGHGFLSALVSFYLIGITSTIIKRYMEARTYLGALHRSALDFVSLAVLFTMHERTAEVKKWRMSIVYHTIILLMSITASTEYLSSGKNVWDLQQLPEEAKTRIKRDVVRDVKHGDEGVVEEEDKTRVWFKGRVVTSLDDNLRVPTFLAFDLRRALTKYRSVKIFEKNLHVNEEKELFDNVGGIMNAWYGLKKLVQTPIPFPLVQNRRYILFFWVFTLPIGLMSSIDKPAALYTLIFFLTLGFIGLEAVIMEIEDPFGNDPNDFNDVGMTKAAIQDLIYVLYDVDGSEAQKKLEKEFKLFLHDEDKQFD